MENTNNWKTQILDELQTASKARALGNEGQARVCARRAAGIAIGEYLSRKGYPIPGPSAMERMKYLTNLPNISPEIKKIIEHLTIRVTKDFKLPIEADLIEETKWLIKELLNEEISDE